MLKSEEENVILIFTKIHCFINFLGPIKHKKTIRSHQLKKEKLRKKSTTQTAEIEHD